MIYGHLSINRAAVRYTIQLACTISGLLLFTCLASSSSAQQAVIILRSQSQVSDRAIRVRDVAEVHAQSLLLKAQIADQKLLDLSPVTHTAEIHGSQVRLNLLVSGVRDDAFVMLGATSCQVQFVDPASASETVSNRSGTMAQVPTEPDATELLERLIAEYLHQQIADTLSLRSDQLHIQIHNSSLTAPPTTYDPRLVTFQLGANTRLSLGRSAATVTVLRDGRVQSIWRGSVQATAIAPVLIAQESIDRGSTLSSHNTTLQSRSIASSRHLTDAARLLGQTMARRVDPGDMITPEMIQTTAVSTARGRPVVRRNTTIPVIARRGSVTVTMPGRAMQDGYVGDFISVRNPDSNKEIPCRIIDADTIEVAF